MIRLAPVYAAAYPLRGPRRGYRGAISSRFAAAAASSTPSRCREVLIDECLTVDLVVVAGVPR